MAQASYLQQPIVTRLPVILTEITQGLLLIPRFQRPFVWKDEQRLRMVDSIERGMPIGSLLVWRTTKNRLNTYRRLGPFDLPSVEEREMHTYVLDGHQRLSTLYGALQDSKRFADPEDDSPRWPIFYDLEEKEFHLPARTGQPPITWLPLSRLFDPVALFTFQKKLINAGKEKLARRAEAIANKFKDYQIPIIPIVTEDLTQATESFQRVNSQGTKMSEVHMINALMWSRNFDLNEKLEQIVEQLSPSGWGQIETDVLLDTVKLTRDLDIYTAKPAEVIAALKEDSSLLETLPQNLQCAIELLAQHCYVRGPAILPYTYQLAILADAARVKGGVFTASVAQKLAKWFWMTTYTAYFSGMTSTQLRNAARHVRSLITEDGVIEPPDMALEVRPVRKFDFNSARTRALVLVLLQQSRLDHEVLNVDAEEFVGELGVKAVPKMLNREELGGAVYGDGPENRWIVAPKQARVLLRLLKEPKKAIEPEVLSRHMITAKARSAIGRGNFEGFLSSRRLQILALERAFVEKLGLTFDDSGE